MRPTRVRRGDPGRARPSRTSLLHRRPPRGRPEGPPRGDARAAAARAGGRPGRDAALAARARRAGPGSASPATDRCPPCPGLRPPAGPGRVAARSRSHAVTAAEPGVRRPGRAAPAPLPDGPARRRTARAAAPSRARRRRHPGRRVRGHDAPGVTASGGPRAGGPGRRVGRLLGPARDRRPGRGDPSSTRSRRPRSSGGSCPRAAAASCPRPSRRWRSAARCCSGSAPPCSRSSTPTVPCARRSRTWPTPSSTCGRSRRRSPTCRRSSPASAQQEAAIAALDEQRDLRIRQRDAQRAELRSLDDGVSAAARTPLPDDGAATAEVSRDVLEVIRNGGRDPQRGADPSDESGERRRRGDDAADPVAPAVAPAGAVGGPGAPGDGGVRRRRAGPAARAARRVARAARRAEADRQAAERAPQSRGAATDAGVDAATRPAGDAGCGHHDARAGRRVAGRRSRDAGCCAHGRPGCVP